MSTSPNDAATPRTAERAEFESALAALRRREKAHTREGDAIAAARRRLPMVEVDPTMELTGADGPVPLLDVFDGRRQLLAYYSMWHGGHPAAQQRGTLYPCSSTCIPHSHRHRNLPFPSVHLLAAEVHWRRSQNANDATKKWRKYLVPERQSLI